MTTYEKLEPQSTSDWPSPGGNCRIPRLLEQFRSPAAFSVTGAPAGFLRLVYACVRLFWGALAFIVVLFGGETVSCVLLLRMRRKEGAEFLAVLGYKFMKPGQRANAAEMCLAFF